MTSTDLVAVKVGDEEYMVPTWMTGLQYVTTEHLEDLTLQAIASAPTLDDAMAEPSDAEKLAEHGGEIITVLSAGWRESDIKDSRWPVYALFDVKYEDGRRELFSCGSSRVMAVLDRAAREDAFPLTCRVYVGDKRAGGKHEMLGLVRVNKHTPFPDEDAEASAQ